MAYVFLFGKWYGSAPNAPKMIDFVIKSGRVTNIKLESGSLCKVEGKTIQDY